MHLYYRNVNDAFRYIVELFQQADKQERTDYLTLISKRPSRNGNTLTIDEPMAFTYSHPQERVLFNVARDNNPFLCLYEALYMLAGRNDVAPLAYYAKQWQEYSDDGKTLNGSYGYRWRHSKHYGTIGSHGDYTTDQLAVIINHLKADPNSRRAVLQMWNVEDDLLNIGASKDVCCNLSVLFSIRDIYREEEQAKENEPFGFLQCLDITVTNRSNDLVWGMLGTNFVTFSILQEYVAAHLGVEVGRYHHFTNNLHVYSWNFKPEEWLAAERVEGKYTRNPYDTMNAAPDVFKFVPLVKDPKTFDEELRLIVNEYKDSLSAEKGSTTYYREPFLTDVATPIFQAFGCYKAKMPSRAVEWCEKIAADDWRIACMSWLERRINKKEVNL